MRIGTLSRPRLVTSRRAGIWLLLALLAVTISLGPLPGGSTVPVDHHIWLEAGSFAFDPGTIRVNRGDRVTIQLVATDVVHGLYLDGYDLEVTADPGQPGTLTFVADRSGSFRFRCSVTCGALHPFMTGRLQVGRNGLLWKGAGLAVLALVAGLFLAMNREPGPGAQPS